MVRLWSDEIHFVHSVVGPPRLWHFCSDFSSSRHQPQLQSAAAATTFSTAKKSSSWRCDILRSIRYRPNSSCENSTSNHNFHARAGKPSTPGRGHTYQSDPKTAHTVIIPSRGFCLGAFFSPCQLPRTSWGESASSQRWRRVSSRRCSMSRWTHRYPNLRGRWRWPRLCPEPRKLKSWRVAFLLINPLHWKSTTTQCFGRRA